MKERGWEEGAAALARKVLLLHAHTLPGGNRRDLEAESTVQAADLTTERVEI